MWEIDEIDQDQVSIFLTRLPNNSVNLKWHSILAVRSNALILFNLIKTRQTTHFLDKKKYHLTAKFLELIIN
jgi:hypothetical protein